jgi:hypothetical protein
MAFERARLEPRRKKVLVRKAVLVEERRFRAALAGHDWRASAPEAPEKEPLR